MYAPLQQFYVPAAVRVARLRPSLQANLALRVNENRINEGDASHTSDDA
jgi:hypothetical protein